MVAHVGVSYRTLQAALHRGDLAELHPGVYVASVAVCSDPAEAHAQRALARQVRTPNLVASHQTAALAHELPLLHAERAAEEPPRFTRHRSRSTRTTPLVAARPLPPAHVTDIAAGPLAGLRLTTPARTAIDLAAELDLPEALMLLDCVARRAAAGYLVSQHLRGSISDRVMTAALRPLRQAQVVRPHWNRRASRALALTDPRRESPGESLSFGEIAAAGLPLPECQAPLETDRGVKWLDFDWPEFGVSGECHGAIKYDGTLGPTDGVLVAEAERHHSATNAGRSVVAWDVREMVIHPQMVISRIANRLIAHGWDGTLRKV